MKLNFENGNFDVEIIGSHGQGTIDATFAELKHCFGNPKGIHDDHKCDVEWNIKFADGTIACIYNWKNGLNYCGVGHAQMKAWLVVEGPEDEAVDGEGSGA